MARRQSTLKIVVKEDNTDKMRQIIRQLQYFQLEVGIFGEDGFYAMLANVHEFGMTITAKKNFLTIPTPEAGDRKPSEIPGLFRPKGKNILATSENGQLKVMFILKKSVVIPERSFMRSTFDEKKGDWNKFVQGMLNRVFSFEMSVDQMYEQLGARIQGDIQQKITSLRTPPNAPLTVERKNSSNPLIDSGALRQRVTWVVSNK